MGEHREKGAIVVEATISLTVFIFTIFIILSVVDICYIQAKIGNSMCSAAKEISQYSYLYYKFSLDEAEGNLHAGAADSRETVTKTIDGISTLFDSVDEAGSGVASLNLDSIKSALETGGDTLSSIESMYAEQLKDPKTFVVGMAKLALDEGTQVLKNEVFGKLLGRALMKKNLVTSSGGDADKFLKKYGVVDGINGLDFKYTSLMAYGEKNEIQLVVTYKVKVLNLLNQDYTFTFTQCAKTKAWGNGVSLITPRDESESETASSVWDNKSDTTRGKLIVLEEKKNYEYTSSGKGFHAYNKDSNEFVLITSVNTHDSTYVTSDGIKNRLSSSYNDMESKVSELGESIQVQKSNGSTETLTSAVDSRKYKLVLVVPDDADMTVVNKAKDDFIAAKAAEGKTVTVEIKTGYGSPTPETESEAESESEPS